MSKLNLLDLVLVSQRQYFFIDRPVCVSVCITDSYFAIVVWLLLLWAYTR